MRRCRSRDCFLNPPFSKPVQILEIRIRRVNRKMPIPINFFNVNTLSSNHVGTVFYTRKMPVPGGKVRCPGRPRAVPTRARRGIPWIRARRIVGEGGDIPFAQAIPSSRCLLRAFSSRQDIFSPPGKECASTGSRLPARGFDRQRGGKLYRRQRFPAPSATRSAQCDAAIGEFYEGASLALP